MNSARFVVVKIYRQQSAKFPVGILSRFNVDFNQQTVCLGQVVALENNMKTPKSFGKPLGVLNVGMGFIVLLYVTIGAIGYVFCVSNCQDSITLNLPQGAWSVFTL